MKEANDKYSFDMKEASDKNAEDMQLKIAKLKAEMRQKNKEAMNNAQELHNTQMKELKNQIVGLEQQVQDLSDSNKEGRSLYDSETANQ